eukprot:364265-Chlamydomonas_euryale.AAC.19
MPHSSWHASVFDHSCLHHAQVELKDGQTVEVFEHGMQLSIVALRGSVPTQWHACCRCSGSWIIGRLSGSTPALDSGSDSRLRTSLRCVRCKQQSTCRTSNEWNVLHLLGHIAPCTYAGALQLPMSSCLRSLLTFACHGNDVPQELSDPNGKQSAGAADVVTLGDAWLGPAIQQRLVAPIPNAEHARWWRMLGPHWHKLLKRDEHGRPSDRGQVRCWWQLRLTDGIRDLSEGGREAAADGAQQHC